MEILRCIFGVSSCRERSADVQVKSAKRIVNLARTGSYSTTTRNRSPVGSPSVSSVSPPSTSIHHPIAQTCLALRSWQPSSEEQSSSTCAWTALPAAFHLAEIVVSRRRADSSNGTVRYAERGSVRVSNRTRQLSKVKGREKTTLGHDTGSCKVKQNSTASV